MATDTAGNIYVSGYTLSSDFPLSPDAIQNWGQGIDLFITKFKPGTSPATFSTYYGGATINSATSMAIGPDNRIYTVGWTTGLVFPHRQCLPDILRRVRSQYRDNTRPLRIQATAPSSVLK